MEIIIWITYIFIALTLVIVKFISIMYYIVTTIPIVTLIIIYLLYSQRKRLQFIIKTIWEIMTKNDVAEE
jgi:hypothetical protein